MSEEKEWDEKQQPEPERHGEPKTETPVPLSKPAGWLSTPSTTPPRSPEYQKGGWGS